MTLIGDKSNGSDDPIFGGALMKHCTMYKKRTWHNPVTGMDYPVAKLPQRKDVKGIWDMKKRG